MNEFFRTRSHHYNVPLKWYSSSISNWAFANIIHKETFVFRGYRRYLFFIYVVILCFLIGKAFG